MFIACSYQRLSHRRGPLADRNAFQFPALAFATSRLNWSCPLKIVLNGNRDVDANGD